LFGISFGTGPSESDLAGLQVLRDYLFIVEDAEALNRGQPSNTVISQIQSVLSRHQIERRRRRLIALLMILLFLSFIAGVLVGKRLGPGGF
jgi:hypothetical protein